MNPPLDRIAVMKDSPLYAQLRREMESGTNAELLADLNRFLDSFGDHDQDCPGFGARGRAAEMDTCSCGFARRYDFVDELERRLSDDLRGGR
jgi:hypothetical protein